VDWRKGWERRGREGGGRDKKIAWGLAGQTGNRSVQRRREPLRCAHLALIADMPPAAPPTTFPHQLRRSPDMALVRVALLNHGERHSMRAEDEVRVSRVGKAF